ncbi:hypothetical protein BP6252_04710 [Coleophoma cylindrospora]|uniref:Uncharacterized protein n=1 Tax=Coleophoma cylindrospora TaxID=1849047 RepID=A0A3D8S188_9HELO|nr:hypothetical protein BP6252_04710 [Coleophoma cylindrospora]
MTDSSLRAGCVNIARYSFIDNLASPGDNSFDYFAICIISIVEIGLGITAASLATCRPLIKTIAKFLPGLRTTVRSQSRASNGRALRISSARMHGATSHSKPPADIRSQRPQFTAVRSQLELEEDMKDWSATCAKAQRRSAVLHLSVDHTRTLSEASIMVPAYLRDMGP